jgi:hypothetical protein
VRFRWASCGLLTVLVLIFFLPLVLHPTEVLYSDHSDLLAEHIPAKRFLVRSWQETGEIPLWCPYHFAGSPFVHDIQVATFYPLHLPLYLLPEQHVGAALSWLIVLHALLAGCAMYAYARHRQLSALPALVAAVGYMFAGKWLLHLLGGGHYITIGLAWLPLVLLCLEKAILRSLVWSTTAGVCYALIVLSTHPQWTFYAGLFAALWTLGAALEEGDRRRALARWLGCGAWAVLVALALAAIQALPTWEATRHTSRAAGVAPEQVGESLRTLLFPVGPSLMQRMAILMWEDRGGLALLWLIAVVLAPLLRGGQVRYQAGVCLGLFLFGACGTLLGRLLPGFNLFRQHPRILVVVSFGVAYLAGVSTEALFSESGVPAKLRRLCWRTALTLGTLIVLLSAGFAVGLVLFKEKIHFHVYWPVAAVLFPLALALIGRDPGPARRRYAVVWSALLLADLWALTWPLVRVRQEADVFRPSACVEYLMGRRGEGRVLDEYSFREGHGRTVWIGSPLGQGAPLALIDQFEAVRGYNPLDVYRYREYLQFIADEDRPLRALEEPFTFPVLGDFRLGNRSLLDLLGVRFLLQPTADPLPGDGWQERREDPHPVAYNIAPGGWQEFPPYTVYENEHALPRAFVVPRARPLPPRSEVLRALKSTDFRATVLLEGYEDEATPVTPSAAFRPADVRSYLPNRVEVHADTEAPGFLVLTDVWYPGWTCTVDGEPATVYRANYVFRAVALPAGVHEVVFRFEPASYRLGKRITWAALAAVPALLLLLWFRTRP